MADWTDGPEYAPHERPGAFVAPMAAPLSQAEAPHTAALTAVAPATPAPTYVAPSAPDLARLIPPPPDTRDPRTAFDVAASPLGGVENPAEPTRRPEEPFPSAVSPVAATGSSWPPPAPSPSWPPPEAWPPGPVSAPASPAALPEQRGPYAPLPSVNGPGVAPGQPGGAPWQAQQRQYSQVTLQQMLKAATPGVMIALALGALITPLSAPLFLVAWALSTRIRYRRATIQRTFLVIAVIVLAISLFSMAAETGGFDLFSLPGYAQPWARLADFALFLTTPLLMGQALRNREPPEEMP